MIGVLYRIAVMYWSRIAAAYAVLDRCSSFFVESLNVGDNEDLDLVLVAGL